MTTSGACVSGMCLRLFEAKQTWRYQDRGVVVRVRWWVGLVERFVCMMVGRK